MDEKSAAALEIRNRMMELGAKSNSMPSQRGGSSGGDSLVRVGNFLGTARGKIESLAQKQVEILNRIEMNTRSTGGKPIYSP
jgi:Tfp pilus assembly protein PilP